MLPAPEYRITVVAQEFVLTPPQVASSIQIYARVPAAGGEPEAGPVTEKVPSELEQVFGP